MYGSLTVSFLQIREAVALANEGGNVRAASVSMMTLMFDNKDADTEYRIVVHGDTCFLQHLADRDARTDKPTLKPHVMRTVQVALLQPDNRPYPNWYGCPLRAIGAGTCPRWWAGLMLMLPLSRTGWTGRAGCAQVSCRSCRSTHSGAWWAK